MTHNCWHNCELTEALQCLAPAYGDEAHRKVATKMEQDMGKVIVTVDHCEEDDVGQARLIVNTNCDYNQESDDWNTLASTLEAAPALLAACKEMLNHIDPRPNDEPLSSRCRVCNRHPTKHDKDCVVLTARAAIAKAKGGA